jgi:hypothetical protein
MLLSGNGEMPLVGIVYEFRWEFLLLFILTCLFCTDIGGNTRHQVVPRCEVRRFLNSVLSGFCRNNSNNSMQVLESSLISVDSIQTLEVLSDRFSSARREFEGLLSINSIDAKIKEAISEVFIKVDEINSLSENSDASVIKLVRQILKKFGESHDIIQALIDDHLDDLSSDDRSRILKFIDHLKSSIRWAENLLAKHESLNKTLRRLLSQRMDKPFRNKDWEVIVIDISTITYNFNMFPYVYNHESLDLILGGMEIFAKHVISSTIAIHSDVSQGIGFENKAKLAPRHYPYIANLMARQLLADIQIKRAVWLEGQSAEAKAIERIQNENLFEWETAPKVAEPIKIEEIRSRLKERGYGRSI